MMNKPEIIFFGNGPLADYALATLRENCNIIFHARTKENLEEVKTIKKTHLKAYGVLASFGVIVKNDILDIFEPEGIFNIHPSLLPKYRGPSPIETAILSGDTEFSVSVMKLVPEMDAGPIYYSKTFDFDLTTPKDEIYSALATDSAHYLSEALVSGNLSTPVAQKGTPTFTKKFDKSMSPLKPEEKTAIELLCQIRAFSGFPKSTYHFGDLDCIIIKAHVKAPDEEITKHTLLLECYDKSILIIDEIQPAGRKVMNAESFINGYLK